MTAEEFAALLRNAKLDADEREIAAQCIVWRMPYIDIAAIVHMDRRTVARRMESVILPELERMMARTKQTIEKAGA